MKKRVFLPKRFEKDMKKSGLRDTDYLNAIDELAQGLHDGDLGGKLYKKSLQAPGQGKRGGYRVIIATQKEERWFFCTALRRIRKIHLLL